MKTTLPERSAEFAGQLADITNVIRELVDEDLAMVILFGSFARGDWVRDRYTEDRITYEYESDFDILIVTEGRAHATVHGEARLADAVRRRLEKRHLDRPSSSIIVEDVAHLNKHLKRGNYFFVDIKKEGVVLYDNGNHTLVEAEPLPAPEAQQYAREDFEHWYKSASEFLG
jgi:predicted nucleotidyltransferase